MVGCVPVPPNLQPLDGAHASHASKRVGPPISVRPDDVDVKVAEQVPVAQVALEAVRPLGRRELILDFDLLVVDDGVVTRDVSYPVRLLERQVQLHLARITVRAMSRMQCVGEDVSRNVARHCDAISPRRSPTKLERVGRVSTRGKGVKAAYKSAPEPRLGSCTAIAPGAGRCCPQPPKGRGTLSSRWACARRGCCAGRGVRRGRRPVSSPGDDLHGGLIAGRT